MIKVIGVRFRTAGKIYFFDPCGFEIKRGDHVIVETARGIEFGTVVAAVKEVEDEKVIQPLKPVLRIATERDIEQEAANKEREREAFKVCLEKIRKHELEMKLIDAEYTFDNNKVLFYFTADGRIDFRELVKDLASVFKTRIELRQIGVRDETKIMGGIGICGRPLCCHSYLSDFVPVSIKMAKEQNLSLNPTKISGVCGRLMCCLKNEEETYEELNRRLPGIGDYVTTEDGLKGEVQSVNVLRQLVKVVVESGDEKEIKEYPVEKLSFRRRGGKREKVELSKEEMQELERLEHEEQQQEQELVARTEGEQRQGKNRQENRNRQNGRNRQENRNRQNNENVSEGRSRQETEQVNGTENGQENENRQNRENRRDGRRQDGRNRQEGRGRQDGENRQDYKRNQQNDGELPVAASENAQASDNGGEGEQRNNRHDGRNRKYNRNRYDNRRQDGNHDRGGQDGAAQPVDAFDGHVRQGNSENRRDGENRHDGENRQNGEYRHDRRRYRNRNDRRNRQEGQSKPNDNQA